MAGIIGVQVSVVQFSNDVRVELAPQHLPMEQLRAPTGGYGVLHYSRSVKLLLRETHTCVCAHMHPSSPCSPMLHCPRVHRLHQPSEGLGCLRRRA